MTLYARPTTTLYDRMRQEGRLDEFCAASEHPAAHRTNIIPLRMSREALRDGFLDLMRDLYTPEAFFGRADALYLDGPLMPNSARARYLRRHPWHWLKSRVRAAIETAGILLHLMTLVPDAELLRQYPRRLWNVVNHPPHLTVLRASCVKRALHFH